MLFICDTKKKYKKLIPAVVHADNTARVQTVNRDNKIFFNILKEFKKITNIPVLINTSFNIGGEAIVNTVEEAINSFNQMDIDYLLVGNFLVKKTHNSSKKKINDFINIRKNLFLTKNPYKRIDVLRLNANFYTSFFKILFEKIKDFLNLKIKNNFFIK